MKQRSIPRIVIAATSSGAGKTTIVSGILASLRAKGHRVQSYKIGPDYIDPGFHQLASGKPCHNLDTWLLPEERLTELFDQTASGADIAIIEGVMGLYDGGRKGISSTAAIAKLLGAPVILVIDAKSMGDSAAAVALGFQQYDPEVKFAGVIINRLGSQSHKKMICEAMDRIKIPVLGCIYRNEALKMPERHLGLTPVTENDAFDTLAMIAEAIGQQVDLEGILVLAKSASSLTFDCSSRDLLAGIADVKIGVAQDAAFSFYYPESLAVLEALGAKIVPFSPLDDRRLPEVDGLILGGGFPEMFIDRLTRNQSMRDSILQAGENGLPIYAECGGFMYLTRQIEDFSGASYDMVGLIPARCKMNAKLQTVGYVEARALGENLLGAKDTLIRGHEFHFSSMLFDEKMEAEFPWAFTFTKVRTSAKYYAGYAKKNILGSYLHLHFLGNLDLAKNFITRCAQFSQMKR